MLRRSKSIPATWPTCLTRKRQPSSSKKLLPPHTPTSNSSAEGEQNEKESKMKPTQTKPGIVFVHGLWADGSCFSKVIAPLQAEGYQVIASQHSLDSLEGDVATVTRTLGRVTGPVLLVGHSYGGTVITAAGTDDRVAGLVYISALAPDETETSQSQQDVIRTAAN